MSYALTATICLLWTIPMSFIASISSLKGLRSEIEFIDDMLDAVPFLEPLLAVLAPLLVVGANSSLNYILLAVTHLEGHISGATVEAGLFVKLAYFFIIQTFFISAISGSLIEVSGLWSRMMHCALCRESHLVHFLYVSSTRILTR
jgi:hypothetical protein